MKRNDLLTAAGILSLGAAAFQLAIGFVPDWSAFFGAPEALVARPAVLVAASLLVALLLCACAAYCLSGAGLIGRLPLLRTVLVVVASLFLVRGLVFVPLLLAGRGVATVREPVPATALWSSAAFLVLALLYLAGVITNWRGLRPTRHG